MNLFLPNIAYASVDSFLTNVNKEIINPFISLLFALAVAYFLWGVFEFIASQDNDEKKTAGKSRMLWGVVGITIMMGVFTFMNIILSTFNIDDVNPSTGEVHLDPYSPTFPP